MVNLSPNLAGSHHNIAYKIKKTSKKCMVDSLRSVMYTINQNIK